MALRLNVTSTIHKAKVASKRSNPHKTKVAMSKRRADKTKYWVKPPDGDPHQTGTWRPYGPLTLHEIARMLDWQFEVIPEGQILVTMKDCKNWLPLSVVCPKNPKEIFTDEDMFWRNW